MAIKQRKQLTGTTAQINAYAGVEGQLVWDKTKKKWVGMSGTAGTNYPMASESHTHSISNVTNLQSTLDGKQPKGDYATSKALTDGLAGKANTSHTHPISQITNLQASLDAKTNDATLQVDLTAIRESITNVSSKVDGIGDTLSPTYAKKQGILDACDKALNGANPVSAGDPALDEIKTALANLQADVGVIPTPNAYVVETWKAGTEWYRVWDNGFIEQGGTLSVKVASSTSGNISTITLHKGFSNTAYQVFATFASNQIGNSIDTNMTVWSKTNTTISLCSYDAESRTSEAYWYACGY